MDIDGGLVNGQRFDSRLLCANSKPVLNLSKAGFLNLFVPGLGRRRDQRIVRLRAEVWSLTEKKEQGTSVSQGTVLSANVLTTLSPNFSQFGPGAADLELEMHALLAYF